MSHIGCQKILARSLHAKEMLTPKRGEQFVFATQMEQQNCLEEINESEKSTLRWDQPAKRERRSQRRPSGKLKLGQHSTNRRNEG